MPNGERSWAWLVGTRTTETDASERRRRAWVSLALSFGAFLVSALLAGLAFWVGFAFLLASQWAAAQFTHRFLEVGLKRSMKIPLGLVLGVVTTAALLGQAILQRGL